MNEDLENKSNPETDENVVSHNLEMMETDMTRLSMKESMGGNAGGANIDGKIYPCVSLNGYADKEIGKILAFGNPQNISSSIKHSGLYFTFKEAINFDIDLDSPQSKTTKIVDFFGAEKFSERGRKNIASAIDTYNTKHWR